MLLQSSLEKDLELVLLDSTQRSVPPPGVTRRALDASRRIVEFIVKLFLHRPDTVLIFCGSGPSLAEKSLMSFMARMLRRPVLLFPRGGGILRRYRERAALSFWVRVALKIPTKVLCQGESWQRLMVHGVGRLQGDAPIVRNWSATPKHLSIAYNSSETGPVRLLFVGWLKREKGVFDLVNALATREADYPVVTRLVGDGDARRELTKLIEKLGLGGEVVLAGWKSAEELLDEYAWADVFVLPSWVEGLPNSMIEAMASGLPVVVTPVGNVPDVIQNGENGLIAEARNPRALAAAIDSLVDNPQQRARLSCAARQTARSLFGLEAAARALIDLVNQVSRPSTR
ncbi:MAG: glycosyltransferase family 4 protein [Rhodothermales bacterium]|nr:glycosyltransferase family 4 protein [Rhodothermales bacterium]MBO6781032.1 glycosyltransferase family 4 protein [Rhodothermales bacterium]